MRMRWRVVIMLLAVGTVAASWGQHTTAAKKKPFRDSFRTASDGVTKGWLVEYPWPDQDDVSQSWRTVAWTLEIEKQGKIVRKFQAGQTFWRWNFWNGGREVVVEEGPPHGTPGYVRMDIKSGKELETWEGDAYEKAGNAPAWVRAAVVE